MQYYDTRTADSRWRFLIPSESSFAARQSASARTRGNVPCLEFMAIPVETHLTTIPFTGFYNSTHDSALDSAIEQMFSDKSGEPIDSLVEKARDAIDWRVAMNAYARLYCRRLAHETDSQWEFERLDSPRFYNYRSDEIEVQISAPELQRIYDACDKESLAAIVAERLRPCDGFVPFYSDKLADWPDDVQTWESAQIGLLIECHCDLAGQGRESRDCWLVDDCNGDITQAIESAIDSDTLNSLYAERGSRND